MKKLLLGCLIFFVVACKNGNKNETLLAEQIHQEWYANWVGDFTAKEYKEESNYVFRNKINIKIISISKQNEVVGQSIVAGNMRPLKGSFDSANNKFILKESGTNKYDGVFEFEIKKDSLIGFWSANDKTLDVTKRTFELVQKQFVYNKMLMLPISMDEDSEGYVDYSKGIDTTIISKEEDSTYTYTTKIFRAASEAITTINASTKELQVTDLKNLKKLDLEIIRNTIYARHGFTFGKKSVRQFFDFIEWYVPISHNVEAKLTKLEIKNIALLKRFEKYAEDNYDTFGR